MFLNLIYLVYKILYGLSRGEIITTEGIKRLNEQRKYWEGNDTQYCKSYTIINQLEIRVNTVCRIYNK